MARTQGDRRAETRALLIAAAADLFARKGFHAVSAEAVGDAANRTTGALYDHFGGKEGLLLALLEEWMEQTIADLDHRARPHAPMLDDRHDGAVARHLPAATSETQRRLAAARVRAWLHGVRDPQIGEPLAERFRIRPSRAWPAGLEQWSDTFGFTLPAPS